MRLGMETPTSICLQWNILQLRVWPLDSFGSRGTLVPWACGQSWLLAVLPGTSRLWTLSGTLSWRWRNAVISCLSPETERKKRHFFCFAFIGCLCGFDLLFFQFPLMDLSFLFLLRVLRNLLVLLRTKEASLNIGCIVPAEKEERSSALGWYLQHEGQTQVWHLRVTVFAFKNQFVFFFIFSVSAKLKPVCLLQERTKLTRIVTWHIESKK